MFSKFFYTLKDKGLDVSLSEWLLNLFYHNCLYPWLEEVFHIRFFMAGWEQQPDGILLRGTDDPGEVGDRV